MNDARLLDSFVRHEPFLFHLTKAYKCVSCVTCCAVIIAISSSFDLMSADVRVEAIFAPK